jgi:hypothetical protein
MSKKMPLQEAVASVRTLLGGRETVKSAPAMRDRLIALAGDRTKLVKLMDAVGALNSKEAANEK